MSSNMEECKKTLKSFEEGWPLLQTAVDKLINQIEGGVDNPSFTTQEYMSYYTTVYELCAGLLGGKNSKLLYVQYKKVIEEYINSTVLPSLREKKDELLLRELLRRWSNHKIMIRWLSIFFCYLDRFNITGSGRPSLVETGFLSFYDLVYDEMNKQVMDAILAMGLLSLFPTFQIDQERTGEQIDRTLVYNTLSVYSEIGDRTGKNNAKHFAERMIKENAALHYDEASNWIASSSFIDNTPKEEKLHDIPTASSKKINLISADGDVFEVDYDVALMSKTIEDIIETNPVGDNDNIPVSLVSSKVLAKVIEYCKKHSGEHMSDVDLRDWDFEFVDVGLDHETLLDLVMSANYMNIQSLLDLTSSKVADMIKGKTPEEIRHFFSISKYHQ